MVSSAKHHSSKGLNLEDLHYHTNKKAYSPMQAYGDSKLANILFAKEYDRRQVAATPFQHSLRAPVLGLQCLVLNRRRFTLSTH